MPRFRNVNGVQVQFTAEEETARDAEEAAYLANLPAEKAAAVRAERDRLLKESDKSQLSDWPANLVPQWQTYRTALRDLPDHANFPDLLPGDWPVEPT